MKTSTVRDQATQWLVRLQTAEDIDSHWRDFEAWLDQDPSHLKAYTTVEHMWSDLEFLEELVHKREPLSPRALMRNLIRESRRRRLRMSMRIAGLVLLVCGAATLFMDLFRAPVDEQTWTRYERGADQVTPVTLADGSSVQLNDNTHIRIGSGGRARDVILDNGEAYFEVKPRVSEPFSVNAGAVMISSQDAAFTIRREGDGHIETIVRYGRVDIASTESGQGNSAHHGVLHRELSEGQIATISPSQQLDVVTIDPSHLERRLAWINNFHSSDVVHAEGSTSTPRDIQELQELVVAGLF